MQVDQLELSDRMTCIRWLTAATAGPCGECGDIKDLAKLVSNKLCTRSGCQKASTRYTTVAITNLICQYKLDE